ncbi:hypothetical protein [Photobacterium damselae]|uniref:Uncharacterized protein n=2 Tax=Photobacterium damselae TaxID=38293 RepID=A0A2X1XT92_PHODM|nr:hypothetical protein [Photobacterium damselae]SPY43994.1 Uncharacterised protein [Photobacterium damselae]
MAWPWLFTMSRSFGRALIVAIYPKKSVILEIEEEDGSIVRKTVKLSSDEELVKMILSHEKIRVMD